MGRMAQQQIVQYIKDNLKRGYSPEQVKESLIASGYNPFQIDEALAFVSDQPDPGKGRLWGISFLAITILVSIFIITSALSSPEESPSISYSIHIKTQRVQPGDTLVFENDLQDQAIEGYSVYPRYEITMAESHIRILSWKESSGITGHHASTIKIDENLKPGKYYLTAYINFRGQEIRSEDTFYVFRASQHPTCTDGMQNQDEEGVDCGGPCRPCISCSDGIKNQGEIGVDCGGPCRPCEGDCKSCNDYNACTKDSCINNHCVNEFIFPCCGNFICETGESEISCPADCAEDFEKDVSLMSVAEVRAKARSLARTDERKAGEFCNSIDSPDKRDECLRTTAYNSKNKNYCRYIVSSIKRDACYVDFATRYYDYTVCPLVENPYHQRACEALKARPGS